MKNWLKLTLIKDIQVFIDFANFYQRFIQGFSKIIILLISRLKTIRSSKKLALKVFKTDNNKFVYVGCSRTNETVINLSNQLKNDKSRNLTYMPNIEITRKTIFLTLNTKKIFNNLRLAFIKALILQHFDSKSFI